MAARVGRERLSAIEDSSIVSGEKREVMNKLTQKPTSDLIKKGITFLKWEATKVGGKLVFGVVATLLPLAFGGFLTNFELPSMVMCGIVLAALGKAGLEELGIFCRRLQEIEM